MALRVPQLVDDLLRPEAYPEPRPTEVWLVTTHISWVFITDREVWKVKRPVNYGFVDYTGREQRRHFCEAEVRLNRRLAPDVYLGVVPVRLHGDRHSFTGRGPVVDYAVRMRRLAAEASADALLRRDALTLDHLDRLATRLSNFYAETAPVIAGNAVETIAANVGENFDQTRPFIGRFVAASSFQAVRNWQREWLERRADRFARREAEGRVRDGHGDLRLEHVYFESESKAPLVIDAIEFNDRFRVADVAADVAFFAMELDARKRRDLAEGFLGALAQDSNDYDLYGVIDFYLSYRAWVRGKIAAFVADDPGTPPPKAARKVAESRALFALAESYTQNRSGPAPVIAVGGVVGAGKSTLAAALGRARGLPVVGSDRTRKHLAGVPVTARAPEDAYTPTFSQRTFDELFRRVEVVVQSGRGVVLDATFGRSALRQRARDLARRHGRVFRFVEVTADDATLRERLRRRATGPSVSDATEGLLDLMRRDFEPPTELLPAERIVVDGRAPLTDQLDLVERTLAGREPSS